MIEFCCRLNEVERIQKEFGFADDIDPLNA